VTRWSQGQSLVDMAVVLHTATPRARRSAELMLSVASGKRLPIVHQTFGPADHLVTVSEPYSPAHHDVLHEFPFWGIVRRHVVSPFLANAHSTAHCGRLTSIPSLSSCWLASRVAHASFSSSPLSTAASLSGVNATSSSQAFMMRCPCVSQPTGSPDSCPRDH